VRCQPRKGAQDERWTHAPFQGEFPANRVTFPSFCERKREVRGTREDVGGRVLGVWSPHSKWDDGAKGEAHLMKEGPTTQLNVIINSHVGKGVRKLKGKKI
jgi:hypothetical protein